jgi:hypothetical protein
VIDGLTAVLVGLRQMVILAALIYAVLAAALALLGIVQP